MDDKKGKLKMAEYIKKSNNLCVVAASGNYLAALNALLNSIDYHKIDTDVLLLSFRLPEDYIKKIRETFDFQINIIDSGGDSQVNGTAIERFNVAVQYGKQYDAICLLDCDMFFVDDVARYFYAASRGVIVVGHNGMHIAFTKKHQDIYNIDLGVEEYPHYQIHTTAPIFLGPNDLDWFDALYKADRVDSFDDFLFLNIIGIKMGKTKRMIVLSPTILTQMHHFGVKPNTRIIKKGGVLMSETEERVAIIHGKWFDYGWYTGLMMPMDGYFRDNNFTDYHKELALESREIVLNEFLMYCYKHKLDLRGFLRVEWLEKKLIQ